MHKAIRRTWCVGVVLAALIVPATPVAAFSWLSALIEAGGITRDEAAAKVRTETGGRVLGVEQKERNGDSIYEVKVLLPDGMVRVVTVPK